MENPPDPGGIGDRQTETKPQRRHETREWTRPDRHLNLILDNDKQRDIENLFRKIGHENISKIRYKKDITDSLLVEHISDNLIQRKNYLNYLIRRIRQALEYGRLDPKTHAEDKLEFLG